jgi:hypothetical protein
MPGMPGMPYLSPYGSSLEATSAPDAHGPTDGAQVEGPALRRAALPQKAAPTSTPTNVLTSNNDTPSG